MDDGSVRRDMNMLQLIPLFTLLPRTHSLQRFAWVSSICLWRSVAGTQVKDPLLGIDEVSGDVGEGGFFHADHCCRWNLVIWLLPHMWFVFYCIFCLFIKCCVIEYVAISHTSWFTDTFFTCKCCLNMDTFYNFDTSWVGSLRPLLILCINTMHSNIGRKVIPT